MLLVAILPVRGERNLQGIAMEYTGYRPAGCWQQCRVAVVANRHPIGASDTYESFLNIGLAELLRLYFGRF